MAKLIRGTQIVYLPPHAERNLNHPDVEYGFITSGPVTVAPNVAAYYARYWRKGHPGKLRTKANSECTSLDCIVVKDSVPQNVVNAVLAEFC